MSTHPHTNLSTQVDRTKDPDFFVRFMDETQKLPAIQASKRLMLERIALAPGEAVLDVGCGPGTDVFAMGELVGPAGRLVGLDASEVMIAEARRRAKEVHAPITFEVGEARALPFPDGTFDVCRAERLLEHLPDAERALAEMVRVTRPGGRILAFDFDWDTLIIDHPDKETTRTIVRSYSDSIRNGWIGRQLPRLFKEQHLEILSLDPVQVFVHYAMAELFLGSHLTVLQTSGTLSASRARQWWEYLQHADEHGTLLISFTTFIIVGAKN
ncbi:MAG TPA: methyltransferase domain-containing protein [Chloroflexota bacterium]|jgi:ubiquinone/menaquinone biosynthesis C-methylase UbiE